MSEDAFGDAWRAMRRVLRGERRERVERNPQPEPLCIYRLERRRMLSANFSLVSGGLVLDGFAAGGSESLSIAETADAYQFETSGGWQGDQAAGVTVDGETLSIDKSLAASLSNGLTVEGDGQSPLAVTFGEVDFSALSGPLQIIGVTALQQQPLTSVTAPSVQPLEITTSAAGVTISSMTVVGDLNVFAFGAITDTPGTSLKVVGNATFTSLDAVPAGDFNGDGVVDNADRDVWQADAAAPAGSPVRSDANNDGVVDNADFDIWQANFGEVTVDGGITLADTPTDEILITGRATFRSLGGGLGAGLFDISVGSSTGAATSFGSVAFTGDDVAIVETDARGTTLTGDNIANTLSVATGGDLVDTDHSLRVSGDASFDAAGSIVLSDAVGETINVGDTAPELAIATFRGESVSVGDGGAFGAELLRFESPGAVLINENGTLANSLAEGTRLTGASEAGSLDLRSSGEIAFDPDAATEVRVAGDASFAAVAEIRVAETEDSLLVVGDSNPDNGVGVASFAGATINVGRNGLFDAEGLRFETAGVTDIREGFRAGLPVNRPPANTMLVGQSEAGFLRIESAGDLEDAAGASIVVSGDAEFVAGGQIVLNDQPFDSLLVADGLGSAVAVFRGSSIAIGDGLGFATDLLRFDSPGEVRISEQVAFGDRAIGTEITGVNRAGSLVLNSVAGIDDADGASIRVNGPAQFLAGTTVTLADAAGDLLLVTDGNPGGSGEAHFSGTEISVGGEGEFAADGVSFDSLLAVEIREDLVANDANPGTRLVGGSRAGSLVLESEGALADALDATVLVTGDASFVANGSIVLADADGDVTENSVVVEGAAQFIATGGAPMIDVGVDAGGAPADATVRLGTLAFEAVDGTVRIAEEDGILLAGDAAAPNRAAAVELSAGGSIEDQQLAETRIDRAATFSAGGDVVLGDDGAVFEMVDATPFLADHFLAIDAQNASVQVSSDVNVRAGVAPIEGTYTLVATGFVAQVGDGPLAAERIAIESQEAAVLLSNVEVTSDADDPHANLALHAGGQISLAKLIAPGGFPLDLIPSNVVNDFSPISVDASGVTEGARVGSRYGVVAVVHGDATVGEVADPTEALAPLVGVAVRGGANAYLQTLAADGEAGDLEFTARSSLEEGAGVPDGTVVQMDGGVFTAVAAGVLSIDTVDPDQPAASGLRTTALRSASGVVTSVGEFTTPDGITGETLLLVGPRFVLDPADDAADAATTALILAETDFEQRVTAAIGSRGEEGIVIVVDWADVLDPFRPELPSSRVPLDANLPGLVDGAEVIFVPVDFDASQPEPGLTQQTTPPLDFRVITIRHNYAESFIPANPLVDVLPTGLTVFNDPAINLYDQFQQTEGPEGVETSFRNLNTNQNAVEASIISVQGFTLPLPRETSPSRLIVETPFIPTQEIPVADRQFDFEERVSVTRSIEVILFGKVDPEDPTRWATDVPGEVWPMEWLGSGTTAGEAALLDQIRDIKEYVNEGPFSEGNYRIVVETPRGQQPLEEWVKGDRETPADTEEPFVEDAAAGEPVAEEPAADAAVAPNLDDGAAMSSPAGQTITAATAALVATTKPKARVSRLMRQWRRSRSTRTPGTPL